MIRRLKNPPNPFDSQYVEWLGEPPVTQPQVYLDQTRTILAKNESPDLPFTWSVNPYRGCFHACAYCYARPSHEYLGWGAGSDFENRLVVKKDAPRLLREAFMRSLWKGELVVFSGDTDCYQPLEAGWHLTRECLQVCLEFRNPVGIVTKSALIQKDLDLLMRLSREAHLTVYFSIPFADEKIARLIEPQAPTLKRRLEALKALSEAGVFTGVLVAPVIPGLNDEAIPAILKAAKAHGARQASFVLLRLSGSVREVFLKTLRQKFPGSADKIIKRIREVRGGKITESEFFYRQRGEGEYWKSIEQIFNVHRDRLGLNENHPLPPVSPFRRPSPQSEFVFS
ncbi:MAG: PA0069 family radical SAM protein [Candidatus Omnitrophica bacterium]|nr:PA0069 family radical SAM protein [Candidatus Omnitrophota bacterium]